MYRDCMQRGQEPRAILPYVCIRTSTYPLTTKVDYRVRPKVQIAESLGSAIGSLTNRLQDLVAMWSWPRVNFEVFRGTWSSRLTKYYSPYS